ncbi:hypothetical protein [Flavobacterium gilvum]|uniref:Lipoprotein n=1 Tax=Flavobacterium gilvum TaxID=1492737 RepID=A0AAC9I502_9FLAO|nr:hypothetical protein [Flavobacterium gilvum]AOW09516.1 hypothetical protein EM308_08390 [Flavobacterium gilvum]KFC60023.1 hypothetical protein FEM08_12020 [Flavobacterium gilvum]
MKNVKLNHFLSIFCFVVLATTLVACKSTSVVPPTTTQTNSTVTVKEIIHDTVFEVKKDSSYYEAYLECVNGKVVINQPSKVKTKKGSYLKPPKVEIKDNMLKVDCEAEAQKLFAQWKETYINKVIEVIQKHPYIVEKELSWWQKTQIILGRIFLFIAFLLGLGFVLRNRI